MSSRNMANGGIDFRSMPGHGLTEESMSSSSIPGRGMSGRGYPKYGEAVVIGN